MAKMRPCQTVENSTLKKHSHPVASLVGVGYDGMSVVREIKAQSCKSSKEVQKYLHNLITDNASSSAINPNIKSAMERLTNLAVAWFPAESQVAAKGIIQQLVLSSITEESFPEIKATTLHLGDSNVVSRKLYNICFHVPNVLAILSEWLLIGNITRENALKYATILWNSINQLYHLTEAEFGIVSAAVLQEWYKAPKNCGGVEEAYLVGQVIGKYSSQIPDLNEACVIKAVDTLMKYHCVDVRDGVLYVKESIVLE